MVRTHRYSPVFWAIWPALSGPPAMARPCSPLRLSQQPRPFQIRDHGTPIAATLSRIDKFRQERIMNESVSTSTKPVTRDPVKPPRSVRMEDVRKKHVKTSAVAAGSLLALMGLAAVLLGA
jgi:hypothetical protein